MPWTRRDSTVVWTFGTALCVYALLTFLLIRKVFRTLVHVCGPLTGQTTAAPGSPPTAPVRYGEYVYGYFVPSWVFLVLWLILPTMFLGFELFYAIRRWRRDRLGLCVECGYRLRSQRGCCPGCGTRIGAGLPTRRYVLTMPRNG
jgi:hypothetical protein